MSHAFDSTLKFVSKITHNQVILKFCHFQNNDRHEVSSEKKSFREEHLCDFPVNRLDFSV